MCPQMGEGGGGGAEGEGNKESEAGSLLSVQSLSGAQTHEL